MEETRNSKMLESFVAYCEENPQLRFWQALRNWCGWDAVMLVGHDSYLGDDSIPYHVSKTRDTFHWEVNKGMYEWNG